MRIDVRGAGPFLGAHLAAELRRRGHEPADGPLDVAIHAGPEGIRAALDAGFARGARLFVHVATAGGRAEDRVRASGLPWVIVRPDVLWGPGDASTRELAWFLRRMPFVPRPHGGPRLAPVAAADAAAALIALVERPELWGQAWSLRGPEELGFAEIVDRVARAVWPGPRRRLRMPAWLVPLGRALPARPAPPLPFAARRRMTVDAVRDTLHEQSPLLSW
jgi:uncharacterized protein YbjT (DUF2867 family)